MLVLTVSLVYFTAPKQVSSISLCLRVLVYTILRTNASLPLGSPQPAARVDKHTGKLNDTCLETVNISVLSHVLQSRLWVMFQNILVSFAPL